MSRFEEQSNKEVKRVYPAPPGVHWAAVLIAQVLVIVAAVGMVPKAYWALVASLVADVWIVYLCVWIRRLYPSFMSLIWCAAFVALELAIAFPGAPLMASKSFMIATGVLATLDVLLWLVTVFVLRAELHFHYNQREPVGLYLSGAMTFFFSYFYFQYHLRRIARVKKCEGDWKA